MLWLESTGASSLNSPQSYFATQQKIKLPAFQILVRSMPWKQSLAPLLFSFFLQAIDFYSSFLSEPPLHTLSHHLLYVLYS